MNITRKQYEKLSETMKEEFWKSIKLEAKNKVFLDQVFTKFPSLKIDFDKKFSK